MCKKYGVGHGFAAAQPTLLQPAKSSLVPLLSLLLPTLLLLKPLLLLTSQMATLGLTSQLPGLTTNKIQPQSNKDHAPTAPIP